MTWLVVRATARLPGRRRLQVLLGTGEPLIDLAVPVDAERDHVRGPQDAPVTLVEYGDFECPYCGRAEPVVRELLTDFGDLRYVWRHLPLNDVHPHTQEAAEAAEAAARQGAFWEMYDTLLANQDRLTRDDLLAHAGRLGLDIERFQDDLDSHAGAPRIAEDVDGADMQRCLRHAHLLHQRPSALRRLRRRDASPSDQGGTSAQHRQRRHGSSACRPSLTPLSSKRAPWGNTAARGNWPAVEFHSAPPYDRAGFPLTRGISPNQAKRRGWDSNPRMTLTAIAGFQDRFSVQRSVRWSFTSVISGQR